MKLVLSDVEQEYFSISEDTCFIADNGNICDCTGHFHCWYKTPGKCEKMDGYDDIGIKFGNCTKVIVISKCVYGSYSPQMKALIDRSITYIHPSFCYRNGEIQHMHRYDNTIQLSAYFYGNDVTEKEKETARKLVIKNAKSYNGEFGKVEFYPAKEALRGIQL